MRSLQSNQVQVWGRGRFTTLSRLSLVCICSNPRQCSWHLDGDQSDKTADAKGWEWGSLCGWLDSATRDHIRNRRVGLMLLGRQRWVENLIRMPPARGGGRRLGPGPAPGPPSGRAAQQGCGKAGQLPLWPNLRGEREDEWMDGLIDWLVGRWIEK